MLTKGDTLFLERPYGKPAGRSKREGAADSWIVEIGPATILYLIPSPDTEVGTTIMASDLYT